MEITTGQKIRIGRRQYTVEKIWAKEVLLSAPKTRKNTEQRIVRRLTTLERMLEPERGKGCEPDEVFVRDSSNGVLEVVS